MCGVCEARNRGEESDYEDDDYEDETSVEDRWQDFFDHIEGYDEDSLSDLVDLTNPSDYGTPAGTFVESIRDSWLEQFRQDIDTDGSRDVRRRWSNSNTYADFVSEAYLDDSDVLKAAAEFHIWDDYEVLQGVRNGQSITEALRSYIAAKGVQLCEALMSEADSYESNGYEI